jgi:hypothetical protein
LAQGVEIECRHQLVGSCLYGAAVDAHCLRGNYSRCPQQR